MDPKAYVKDLITDAYGRAVVLEVPPGTGKTRYSVEAAIDLAYDNRVPVVIFLPTHASAQTAFVYAINYFHYLSLKERNERNLPVIVYYEGVNRFCPIYRDRDVYYKALDYAKRRRWISRTEYERLRALTPEGVMRIFGWSTVCKKVCPLYETSRFFFRERVFVPQSFRDVERQASSDGAKFYVRDAVKKLRELSSRGLVYRMRVKMDFDNGKFEGCCVRMLLTKALMVGPTGRKHQVFFRGIVIIAPTSAVEYLMYSVVDKVNNMIKKGALISFPAVILDEYDTYFYKPEVIPLFSLKWLEFEVELSSRVYTDAVNRYLSGKPFEADLATAAAVANAVLRHLSEYVKKYMEDKELMYALSPVSMIIEVAAEEAYNGIDEVRPFEPRVVTLVSPRRFVENDVIKILEKMVADEKLLFVDVDEVKKKFWWYLQLWEYYVEVYGKSNRIPYLQPALLTSDGRVYETGAILRYDVYMSLAKWCYVMRNKAAVNPAKDRVAYATAYRVAPAQPRVRAVAVIRREVKKKKKKEEEKEDENKKKYYTLLKEVYYSKAYVVQMVSYDTRWYFVMSKDTITFMTSATGLPWDTPFTKTRWGTRSGKPLITFLDAYRLKDKAMYVWESRYTFESEDGHPLKKPIVVVGPDMFNMLEYAKLGRLQVEKATPLPTKDEVNADPSKLIKALHPYVSLLLYHINEIKYKLKEPKERKFNPAIVAVAQRKWVAVQLALYMLSFEGGLDCKMKLEVCNEGGCVEPPKPKSWSVADVELFKFLNSFRASHILVKMKFPFNEKVLKLYVTWFRSKMCRGVDVPDEDMVLHVVVVGSPFRPPSLLEPKEYIENVYDEKELYMVSGKLEICFHVKNNWTESVSSSEVCIAHMPIDISEAINELNQAVGRALRRSWREENAYYVVRIHLPYWLMRKYLLYSQLWVREIYYYEFRMLSSIGRDKKKEEKKDDKQKQGGGGENKGGDATAGQGGGQGGGGSGEGAGEPKDYAGGQVDEGKGARSGDERREGSGAT